MQPEQRTAEAAGPDSRVLAAVDLGSNSFQLMVADFSHGQLRVIDRLREMVRLAGGLDDKGNLVHFTNNGIKINSMAKIEVTSTQETSVKAPSVSITAPKSSFSGDVSIGGSLSVTKNISAAGAVGGKSGTFGGVSVEKHTHNYQDDGAGKVTQGPNQ